MADDPQDKPSRSRWRWLIGVLVSAALILILVHQTLLSVFVVEGVSMEPTLETGQRVVVLKGFYEVTRGDILVFRHPHAPDQIMIKRVVALPGEEIEVRDGRVYVGQVLMGQPWAKPGTAFGDMASQRVPEDALFLVGDNRGDSVDSRRLGPIPRDLVVGKVISP